MGFAHAHAIPTGIGPGSLSGTRHFFVHLRNKMVTKHYAPLGLAIWVGFVMTGENNNEAYVEICWIS